MEDRFIGFNEKRMHIFSELVRRYWNGSLNYISDLDDLATEIKEKYGYGSHEIPFIKDHIRLAMGLDPNGSELFEEELQLLRRNRGVHKPLVSRLEGPCTH